MVYADTVDRNFLAGGVHSHRQNDYRKCSVADENPDAGLYLVYGSGGRLYPEKKSPGFFLIVAACLLIIAALLITLLVEVPIDNQIKTWAAETIPSDWGAIRERWQYFHSARTFVSLASFGSMAIAIIFPKSKN
jgi:Domain of unknown function (DUF1772)